MNNGVFSGLLGNVVPMGSNKAKFTLYSAIFRQIEALEYLMPTTQYEQLRSSPGLR